MQRRALLGLLGAALIAPRLGRARIGPGRGLGPIGLQLYTVRDAMARDVAGTLARVAAIGYREVELAGYFGQTPAALRDLLRRTGLTAPSTHVPLEAVRDDLAATLAAARTIGCRWVTVPWLDQQDRTPAGYRALAAALNRAGAAARRVGLRVAYHNHDFEFRPLGGALEGGLAYDLLLAQTDPALVDFELDVYWIVQGGQDPLAYFARHPGRFPMIHAKDRAADAAGTMVDVGRGAIDWRALFRHRREAGIRHVFVEHDEPADPFASARASYDYLATLAR